MLLSLAGNNTKMRYYMSINWYPGHMTSAKRKMQEELKLVDCIIEILDARAPLSSKNPDIDTLAANKKKVILLNKADLADPARFKKSQGRTQSKPGSKKGLR